jgi:hypothetical protein
MLLPEFGVGPLPTVLTCCWFLVTIAWSMEQGAWSWVWVVGLSVTLPTAFKLLLVSGCWLLVAGSWFRVLSFTATAASYFAATATAPATAAPAGL